MGFGVRIRIYLQSDFFLFGELGLIDSYPNYSTTAMKKNLKFYGKFVAELSQPRLSMLSAKMLRFGISQ